MALLKPSETRAICSQTGERFFWRGWSDRERTLDGQMIQLRQSFGPPVTVDGRPWVTVCGRLVPSGVKVLPRYVDLHLYRINGGWTCQRAFRSEAHGELPVAYHVITRPDLPALYAELKQWDPVELCDTLWSNDAPGGKRRRAKAEAWIRSAYLLRVSLLMDRAGDWMQAGGGNDG